MIDWFLKQAIGFVAGEVKHQARTSLRGSKQKLDMNSAAKAAENRLGYPTTFFEIKKNELAFKSSPMFVFEWFNKSKECKHLEKDEETGDIYLDGKILDESGKRELMNKLATITEITSPAFVTHFNKALELLVPVDITSRKFMDLCSKWDGKPRLNNFIKNCYPGGIEDPEYSSKLFRLWAIGTARRIIEPGYSLDGCLTIRGVPGLGKTQFFRQLMPDALKERTGEIYCDIKSPVKFVEAIVGKSIANFDELASLNENVADVFKQLITTQFIDVRMPWARKKSRYLIRQGFGGTTNHMKFIPDQTISRRIWQIRLNGETRLDFDYLNANKQQMWAEALYYSIAKKESTFLTPEHQAEVEKYNKPYIK